MNVSTQLPKSGGRKFHHMILGDLRQKKIKMGRDKLFLYLR